MTGLPIGTRVELDAETVVYEDGSLYGGSPGRLFRLNSSAAKAFAELQAGVVLTRAGSKLGRRFTDVGLLHPLPGREVRPESAGTVTVVIPVRDRAGELGRCLAALGPAGGTVAEIFVVDDGSIDPEAVAAVVAGAGARLIRRAVNAGPGAARNTALAEVRTPFVAFCDSDCLPEPGWIDALIGHFDDPLVAAVAPRIVAPPVPENEEPAAGYPDRFARARPALDLGDRPARVAPMSRVSYLPTAALLLRCSALENISGPAGFDPSLRYGEDVDLVWRLLEAGHRIRYDPAVRVGHVEPTGWKALLRRRFAYGTSAAPLEQRHPGQVAPLILVAAPAVVVAAVLARRPGLAGAAFAAGYLEVALTLRRSGLPVKGIAKPLARGVQETFIGTGRWTSQFAAPVALGLAAAGPGRPGRRRLARTAMVVGLLAAAPAREWVRSRPPLNVLAWTGAVLADDVAYGAGVWAGSVRNRHFGAVRPRLRWHLIGAIERTKVGSV